jgi:hypothetical protein
LFDGVAGFKFQVSGFKFQVSGSDRMKNIHPIALFVFSLVLMSHFPGAEKLNVTGTVMRQGVWCKGVEPDPEEWKAVTTPKPWANKKLFVKKGKVNDFAVPVLMEFTTDKDGKFTLDLPAGDYCIVDEFKVKKGNYKMLRSQFSKSKDTDEAAVKECLDIYFKTPDLVFTVTANGKNELELLYKDRCGWEGPPCSPYPGDPPP